MSWERGEVLYDATSSKWPEKDEPDKRFGEVLYEAGRKRRLHVSIQDAMQPANAGRYYCTVKIAPSAHYELDAYYVEFLKQIHAQEPLHAQEPPRNASQIERRLAMLEEEFRVLKEQQEQLQSEAKQLSRSAVDLGEVLAAYELADSAQLERRIRVRPGLQATLVGAAKAIQRLFNDGRPKLRLEASGRINVHVPTKLGAEQASVIYDRLLSEWWRGNVSVEDKMSLVLDFI